MREPILGFYGEYRFLSNFFPAQVTWNNLVFPTVENAYQVAKLHPAAPISLIYPFQNLTPGQAKRKGKTLPMREDWDKVKLEVMKELIQQKFRSGSDLAEKLLATGYANIVETNTWGDTFWGVCRDVGQNHLGRILMAQRNSLRLKPCGTKGSRTDFLHERGGIMALNLQQGGQMEPVRMVLYGQNGIGKTTFGAGMNQPFILAVEDGIGTMPVWHDKAHAKHYDEIVQTLLEVGGYFQKGEFKSLIIDSMDALQGKIQEKILRENGKKTLNDFSYGKGYELFKQEWEKFRDLMERFRVELRANVLLIAQTESRTVADPVNGPHDTYVMRLDKRAVGVLRDWADLVGFAQLKADPVRDKDGNVVRLVTNGTRILCTAPNTAFDAKNRFDLPLELPLAWNSVEKAIQEAYQRPFDPARFAQASINGFSAAPAGTPPASVQPAAMPPSAWPTAQAPASVQPVSTAPAAPSAWPAAPASAVVPMRKSSGPGM